MFITLTSVEDGQPVHVRAAHVQAVTALDKVTTSVFLLGGAEMLVRESRDRVRDLVDLADHRSANQTHAHLPTLRNI